MPYVYCVPGTITEFNHALDNKVSGRIEIEGRECTFTTRKHVVLATNRHYAKCSWKPRLGSTVLIDGDLGKQSLLIDHLEDDLMETQRVADPILDQIAATLGAIPNATKTLRHWKPIANDAPFRFRWAGEVGRSPDLDLEKSGVLHAAYDPVTGIWSAWCVDGTTGRLAGRGLPQSARRLLARTFLGPEEKKRPTTPPVRPARPALHLDDCPF